MFNRMARQRFALAGLLTTPSKESVMATVDRDHLQRESLNAHQEKAILQSNIEQAQLAITNWQKRIHQLDGVISFAGHLMQVMAAQVAGIVQAGAADITHVFMPAAGAAEDAAAMAAGQAPAPPNSENPNPGTAPGQAANDQGPAGNAANG